LTGLVPVIHAAPLPANPKGSRRLDDVDDRDKPGHDGVGFWPSKSGALYTAVLSGRGHMPSYRTLKRLYDD
jgi:hypothetical protein